MKANELMIGDWVMVNDIEHTHPLQVAEIFNKCGVYYATLYWDGMPDNVKPEVLTADVDKVLPIPLTPEILEKNGWMKVEADSVFYPKQLKGELPLIVYATDGDNWRFRIKDFCEIEYIHKLQQALRLCDISKEIEL